MKRTIAVAGTIGAGKTSLTRWLVSRFDLVPFYEPNDENPYLADFYEDMPRWAFPSQVFFLAHKLGLHTEHERSEVPAIIDRTIYEDAEIFARNLFETGVMSARDWGVYESLYANIKAQLRPPELLIALTCDLKTTRKRIATRGRAMEAAIPPAYLKRLHGLYEKWFSSYDLGPMLRIDTTRLDYVENLLDRLELEERVAEALR
jgi:deoxyadenosine/deoxycytidine kinase